MTDGRTAERWLRRTPRTTRPRTDVLGDAGRTTRSKPWRDPREDIEQADLFLHQAVRPIYTSQYGGFRGEGGRAAVGMGIPMGIPMGMGMVWVWGL